MFGFEDENERRLDVMNKETADKRNISHDVVMRDAIEALIQLADSKLNLTSEQLKPIILDALMNAGVKYNLTMADVVKAAITGEMSRWNSTITSIHQIKASQHEFALRLTKMEEQMEFRLTKMEERMEYLINLVKEKG